MNNTLLVGTLLASLPLGLAAEEVQRPNVILINIDDQGWTDFSFNGSGYYETPNVDGLRNKGIWFQQAYSGGSNSAPSRACMLTGHYTPRHGIYTVNNSDRGKSSLRKLIPIPNGLYLKEGYQTLTQVMHDHGYRTFHIGKWHITKDPLKCGVDVNIGGCEFGHPKGYFSPYHNPALKDGPKGEFLTQRLADEAVKLIAENPKDQPFFMYYATYAVHPPKQALPEIIDKYKKKKPTEAHKDPVFAAMIESMDKSVGDILQAVKEKGIEENTLIIFTTDNGGIYNISRQWPLRAGKGSFYEGGIRVPLIVYQKGKFEKKEIMDTPVMQMDLFPTLLDLTGIDKAQYLLDGKSLVNLLEDGKDENLVERPVFWHFPAYLDGGNEQTTDRQFRTRPVSVVRKGDWKLIENYETNRFELYNIREDLSETTEISKKYPKKVHELKNILYQWKKDIKAPIPTELNPEYTGKK